MNSKYKKINTVLSISAALSIEEIINAKVLMNTKYGNKYSFLPPHLTYAISPFSKDLLDKAINNVEEYISKLKPFRIYFDILSLDESSNFFYLKINGKDIYTLHKEFTLLLNKYRENYLREKDIEKLENNGFDSQSLEYLLKYGYSRVLKNFKSHVTIGNFDKCYSASKISKELDDILSPLFNKEIIIDNIHFVFHKDSANNQSEMKSIWEKRYTLYDK